jgi:membrane protease YdiL (CAAX protease family)
MSEVPGSPDGGPYPDPRRAILLTIGALFASGLVGVFFIGLGPIAAIGIGQALAVGTIATVSAKRIPEPQAERIGLKRLELGSLPLVLCLVPAILLASELDNYANDWFPTPIESTQSADTLERSDDGSSTASAEDDGAVEVEEESAVDDAALESLRIDLEDPWTIAQAFVISVGIAPVVEEFFFRGVLQQSLVARLGLLRGVGFVAMLYTLPHLPAVASLPRLFIGVFSAFGMGCLLGLVRVATGSILASIVLASLTAAVGIFSFAMKGRLPLPGMNVEGTHLPFLVTLASVVIVGWAVNVVYEEAKKRFDAEHPGHRSR